MANHSLKWLGFAAAMSLGVAAASAASAATVDVTGAGFYPTDVITYQGAVTNAGPGPYASVATGPIQITLSDSSTMWVFCVDWNHVIGAGLGFQQPVTYSYQTGYVTTDSTGALSGTGNALSLTTSGEIQTLVNLGVAAANSGTASDDALLAYQAAIWDIEYGLTQNPGDATVAQIALINADVSYAQAHPFGHYAAALYSSDGGAQGLGVAVPEPSAWALMLVGIGGLGGAMRSRRKTVAA